MPRDTEGRISARKRAETHKSGVDRPSLNLPPGVSLFGIEKAGVVRLDIMPYRVGQGNPEADPGTLYFERTYWTHRGIGPNNQTVVCLAKTYNKACPICQAKTKFAKDPDIEEDVVKGLAAKERQLFNVIDLAHPEKGVQIWDISYHLFGKMMDARIRDSDEDDQYEFFADLANGFTLKVGFGEKSFGGSNFYECTSIDFKPRTKPYKKDILEQVHCLDDVVAKMPYDKLKALFLELDESEEEAKDDEDDDDDGVTPVKKKKPVAVEEDDDDDDDVAPPPKKKKPPVVEEDDDDDEDDDDLPPPKKKPAPKKKAPVVEDDEDDDEDDDDVAPPPKKKAPAKKKPVAADDDDDDDDLPPPKKKKAPAKAADDDDDEWDGWEED
jgi:hypothetical protein